jgi:hypothetical protein
LSWLYRDKSQYSDSIVAGAIIELQLAEPLVPWLHVTSDNYLLSRTFATPNLVLQESGQERQLFADMI